jgi:hypothetical protein
MADLVIREQDGWIEISDDVDELGPVSKQELWEFAATNDFRPAQELLDMELGDVMEERIGTADLTGIKVIATPDDMKGEALRIWIKVS